MNKENRFEWQDYSDRSVLYCGDKYIATVDCDSNTKSGFALDTSVDHSHYHYHDLNASSIDEAKQNAINIIAAEYERAIGQARDKLKEYEGLALGLNELYAAKAHGQDLCSLDDTIKKVKEQGAAEPSTNKGNKKEVSLDEVR